MFHLRCLRRILSISWQDHITNSTVLDRPGIPSVYTLLRQRRLRCIGHVHGMDKGCIPKQLFYGELAQGKRPVGRPKLRFKDVVKRDMQAIGVPIDLWETLASDRSVWKTNCAKAPQGGEKLLHITVDTRRERQKARALAPPTNSTHRIYLCISRPFSTLKSVQRIVMHSQKLHVCKRVHSAGMYASKVSLGD